MKPSSRQGVNLSLIEQCDRVVKTLFVAGLVVFAAAAIRFGPVAAFHRLPPETTGEAARLAEMLGARPGRAVGQIGAGTGSLSVALARRLQPGGRLYASERSPELRERIRERAERAGVSDAVVIQAGATTAPGLPDACCDAVVLRDFYHHVTDPAAFNQSLGRAIRPGGRVVVIDFAPGTFWHLHATPPGLPPERSGHGVSSQAVVAELDRAGFLVERIVDDWGGWTYLIVLRGAGVGGEVTISPAGAAPVSHPLP